MSTTTQTIAATIPRGADEAPFPYELRRALLKRAARIKFAGPVRFWQAPDRRGDAFACNMDGGQVLLKLEDFVEPGRRICLQIRCLRYRGVPFEMTGVVQWCRQNHGAPGLIAVATLIDDTARRPGGDTRRAVSETSVTESEHECADQEFPTKK